MEEETIAAVATPVGEGALAVIRLSGPKALKIADELFRGHKGKKKPSESESHTLQHGFWVEDGQVLDEVVIAIMRGPRTFTTKDTVEISTHGGMLVSERVLDAVLKKGARLAKPGEFTKLAFLNGRIDLTQAEAICDMIRARTDSALAAATALMEGQLYRRIQELYDKLTDALAHIDAHLDFPDEQLKPDDRTQLLATLEEVSRASDKLISTSREGKILREGIRTAIVGKPNVGKSSLLNILLGHDRAIVSPTPGTTRDTIEELANIAGIPLRMIDTAGIRTGGGDIEEEGIRRSQKALETAELVLLVLDGSQKLTSEDKELIEKCRSRPFIVALNKADLPQADNRAVLGDLLTTLISAKTGAGLEELKRQISTHVWQGKTHSSYHEIFVNARQREALALCKAHLLEAGRGLHQNRGFELISTDVRGAIESLGEVTGRCIDEDVLDKVFSQFCIGK